MRDPIEERAYAALCGLALGDSMGMPAEFLPPEEIKRYYNRIDGLVSPNPRHYHHRDMKRGMITDDTEITLEVMDSIIRNGEISLHSSLDALNTWADKCHVFRKSYLGPSTRRALEKIRDGVDPVTAGRDGTTNGAAMRVTPIGILNAGSPAQAALDAVVLCIPTHGTNIAAAGAGAIASAIAEALSDESGLESVIQAAREGSAAAEKLGYYKRPCKLLPILDELLELSALEKNEQHFLQRVFEKVGFSMESDVVIPVILTFFRRFEGDPMQAIRASANLGGDTDTIGALSGAICGAFSGVKGLDMEMVREVEQINGVNLRERMDAFLLFIRRTHKNGLIQGRSKK